MTFSGKIQAFGSVPSVIISVAVMLFSGFLLTRITKLLRLPNVTAYIVAGILIGPYCLNLVPQRIIDGTDFLSDIALAFIAFSTGEFFKLSVLRKNGIRNIVITVFESVLASAFVFVLTYLILRLNLAFSIVLSALASATAPASTMMTIRQTGARGDFVDTLLQVVALDDVVGLILYSAAISIALTSLQGQGSFTVQTLGKPLALNLLVMLLGGTFGFVMKLLMPQKRSKDNKLIISIALLFTFCGVCALLDVSPLLGCMSGLPVLEKRPKDRSNHFELHLELKNKGDLPDFVSTVRALGIRIDDIESNPAYLNSGLSVFTVSFTVASAELKRYKKHAEIIEALSSLKYVHYIEEIS